MLDFIDVVFNGKEERFQELLAVSAERGRAKQDFESRMRVLSVLIADMLYVREHVPHSLVNVDILDRIEQLSDRVSVERLVRMGDFLKSMEASLKTHVNRQMLSDVLALTGNE